MALTDQTRQSETSQLSADAASFVPEACHPVPAAFGSKESREYATLETSVSASAAQQRLPHYLTSCYPFITGDPGIQPSSAPTNTRAHAGGQNSVHPPVPHGSCPVTGGSSTRPVAYGLQQPGYVPFVQPPPSPVIPLSSFCSSSPNSASVIPGVVAYPNHTVLAPVNQLPAFTQVPPPTLQWLNTGRQTFMPQNACVPILPGVNVPKVDYRGSFVLPSAKLNWPAADKKSKVGASAKRSTARAKVIVCRDNCVQTDFNEELARATLIERPNSFFLGTAAPEDVDSDSGYSSPQHRQTTAAPSDSAAVAAAAPLAVVPPPVIIPPAPQPASRVLEATHNVQQPALVTYMADGRHLPMIYAPYPFRGPPSVDMFIPRAKESNVSAGTPRPQSANRHGSGGSSGGGARGRYHNSGNKKTYKQQLNAPKPSRNNQPARGRNGGVNSQLTAACNEPALPFDDVDEFPYLLSAADGLVASQAAAESQPHNQLSACRPVEYWGAPGNAARQQRVMSQTSEVRRTPSGSVPPTAMRNIPGLVLTEKETKALRKKVKRQEIANRAAEKELAEISLEQQVLRELRAKQTQKPGETQAASQASTSVPSTQDLTTTAVSSATATCAMSQPAIVANWTSVGEKSQVEEAAGLSDSVLPSPREVMSADTLSQSTAMLDPAAQAKKIRDREITKSKKPSTLKKVILKEREEKKRQQLNGDTVPVPLGSEDQLATAGRSSLMPEQGGESAVRSASPQSGEVSPVSQMSPYNMSPLSVSPIGSTGVSPIAGNSVLGPGAPGMTSVLAKIHSRRFREYCNQVLDKEIDDCCTELLQDLVRIQEQSFSKESSKSNRRIVMGLREVMKHLKSNQLKCIIISPNMERIQSKGGLDDALNNIIEMSRQQDVPFVFALGRRALGRVCAKLVPVSIVGIFCYDGTEETFHRLCQLTEKARKAYTDMVNSLEKEMVVALVNASGTSSEKDTSLAGTSAPARGNLGGFEKLFPHLGHSRTPSACSAISIISSVLSEPISENYPASDPDAESSAKDTAGRKLTDLDTVGESREEAMDTAPETEKLGTVGYIDAGHEADTEDDSASVEGQTRRMRSASRADSGIDKAKSECSDRPRSADSKTQVESRDLGHSDTVPITADHPTAKPVSRPSAIDSKRIASWVEESQRAIESMRVSASSDGVLPPDDDEEEEVQDVDVQEETEADMDAGVNDSANDGDDDNDDNDGGGEDDDDSMSMKTVDEERSSISSTSHYVEAVDDMALPSSSPSKDP